MKFEYNKQYTSYDLKRLLFYSKIGIAANGSTAKEFLNISTQLGQSEGIKIFNKNIVYFEKAE